LQKLKNEELGRPDLASYQQLKKTPLVLVLDNVRSALNVGSVFRTADAFRIEKIMICGITASPPHRDILKTALGATSSVDWEYHERTETAIALLKSSGYKVYAVEQVTGSIPLENYQPIDSRLAMVFGHEMEGVQQIVIDACDGAIEIRQEGTKHSLNIAVCAGIVCWELHRKLSHL